MCREGSAQEADANCRAHTPPPNPRSLAEMAGLTFSSGPSWPPLQQDDTLLRLGADRTRPPEGRGTGPASKSNEAMIRVPGYGGASRTSSRIA